MKTARVIATAKLEWWILSRKADGRYTLAGKCNRLEKAYDNGCRGDIKVRIRKTMRRDDKNIEFKRMRVFTRLYL